MLLDHRYHRLDPAHEFLANIVYPIQWLADFPSRGVHAVAGYFRSHRSLVKQNASMLQEQLQLEGRLQRLLAVEAENTELRALLQAPPQLQDTFRVAEILKVDSDPYNLSIIINKGSKEGAFIGQPIIDAKGIMGVIVEVMDNYSRVLLLTDASHAVPVETVRNHVRGIAEGVGTVNYLELQYVPTTADVMVGDVLVTSGLGGRFPAGYPVGIVEDISRTANKSFAVIRIKPAANLDRGRQVLMLQKPEQEVAHSSETSQSPHTSEISQISGTAQRREAAAHKIIQETSDQKNLTQENEEMESQDPEAHRKTESQDV